MALNEGPAFRKIRGFRWPVALNSAGTHCWNTEVNTSTARLAVTQADCRNLQDLQCMIE
jgi:hypothetical protein